LRLTSPTEGSPGTISVKFSADLNGYGKAKVLKGV